jgi:hypothetical protein
MTEIPSDIKQAAYDCARGIYLAVDDAGAPYMTGDDVEVIAKAILAERERCAKLIEDNIIMNTGNGKELRPRQDGNQDAMFYASEIRKG